MDDGLIWEGERWVGCWCWSVCHADRAELAELLRAFKGGKSDDTR